jgi:hypothetical protein
MEIGIGTSHENVVCKEPSEIKTLSINESEVDQKEVRTVVEAFSQQIEKHITSLLGRTKNRISENE